MLADCELGSNCSSVSSERALTYSGQRISEQLYDSLHLESVRASSVAERQKPVLVTLRSKIFASVNHGSDIKPRSSVTVDKKRYEARRKFFEGFGQKDLTARTVTETTSGEDCASKSNSTANEKSDVHPVKELDACVTNGHAEGHGNENLNGETHPDDIALQPVILENIVQPNFVELVNVKKTVEAEEVKRDESSETCNEKLNSDSTEAANEKQLEEQHVAPATPSQCDKINDEEASRPPNDLPSGNNERRSPADHCECGEDKGTSDNAVRLELKKQNVRSWIENSVCANNWSGNVEANTYESYCDDITKIVESIDVNIASSRTELDALPDTDTCVKYNLDSTNMSLIYSLTPPAVVDQDECGNDDTWRDLADRSSEWQSDSMKSRDEELGDYIWMEPTTKASDCAKPSLSESSCESVHLGSEKHSEPSGSDILELPSCTIRELKDIDGEVFQNGINESANEIIADLNASDAEPAPSREALQVAQHVIAEIIESVYDLLYLDSSIHDLGVVREVVCHLIDSYRRECSLIESSDPAEIFAANNNNDDNICRIKRFLGTLSPDLHSDDIRRRAYERKKTRESPAVLEFCTVAKKLPIVANDAALELNFRVVKVPPNEYASTLPDICRVLDENSIDSHCRILRKARDNELPAARSEMESWPCDRCCYCREEEEDSTREGSMGRLTPISEELDEIPRYTVDSAANPNDQVDFAVEESTAKRSVSLDDTYTISEVSSVIISDTDETNDLQEARDTWDSSVDRMSLSYDTKEFMRLEKALAESSRLNV